MRTLSGLLVSLLAASLVPLAASSAPAGAAGPTTRTVFREYGDGPVQVAARELIRIVFHGRAGNKVMLRGGHKCPPLLRDPRGDTVAKERGGYWRLPEGGRYVLVRRPCVAAPVTLQLVKLVAPQARPDGRPVRLPAPRRGYLPAVEVVVPQQGRIAVDGGAKGLWDDDLYLDGAADAAPWLRGGLRGRSVSPRGSSSLAGR